MPGPLYYQVLHKPSQRVWSYAPLVTCKRAGQAGQASFFPDPGEMVEHEKGLIPPSPWASAFCRGGSGQTCSTGREFAEKGDREGQLGASIES